MTVDMQAVMVMHFYYKMKRVYIIFTVSLRESSAFTCSCLFFE